MVDNVVTVALMYERGKREQALASALGGWSVTPLWADDEPPMLDLGHGVRVPQRFGGLWREYSDDEPTGREVELWVRLVDGRTETPRVTFVGFDDDFDRQGVPAMRDALVMIFSTLDHRDDPRVSTLVRRASAGARESAIREGQRRRRRNAVDLPRVAELYRAGGARHVAEVERVSEPTAYRWVKAARAAGVLEPRAED